MAPTLYMIHASPPVRAVLITAKAIDLDLIEKEIDLLNGEHLTPEYIKLNPQHSVPILIDDDGFTICDSHAIMAYLVSKYAKNDSLYPQDIKKRAIIDERLHFDSGVAFPRLKNISKPLILENETSIEDKKKEDLREAYEFLEAFLQDKKWIAGDFISIADYSLVSTVTSLNVITPVDVQTFPKLAAWLKRVEELPECEANKKGLQMFAELIKNKLTKV